jgi:hypothetical protein
MIMTLRTKTDMLVNNNLYESFSVGDIRKTIYEKCDYDSIQNDIEYEVWEVVAVAASFIRAYTNEFKFQN